MLDVLSVRQRMAGAYHDMRAVGGGMTLATTERGPRMTDIITPNPSERRTAKMKMRIDDCIRRTSAKDGADRPDREYYFHIKDGRHQVWSCRMSSLVKPEQDSVTLWFLWDGSELSCYEDGKRDEPFTELITGQKTRRSWLNIFTSPRVIGAALAVTLTALVAGLEVFRGEVPRELWSIFTAVIAFFFGRESAPRSSEDE
jgi:hypothetical protein